MRALSFALLASLLVPSFVQADDVKEGEALVKKSDCLSCHQPTRKVVGPSYVDVAKKYKSDKGAVAKLVKKVKAGGAGAWGQVPMSPHPSLSDEDLGKMVKWVLAGAPMSAAAVVAPTVEAAPAAPVAAPVTEKGALAKPARKHKHAAHGIEGHEEKEALAWSTEEELRGLMKAQDCFGCHSGNNSVGEPDAAPWPSFKKMEDRYKKKADLVALVKKVRNGEGALKWGSIPHPAYEHLPVEAVQAAVEFSISGKASQAAPEAGAAKELSAEEWMKTRSDCFSCHQVAQKVVGPAYRDVAKKYAEKDVATLVKKVKNGGSGNWGNVPMTAHASASDEQLEKAVRWILSLK